MNREVLEALAKKFADEGRLIEAGYIGMRMTLIPPTATEGQVRDMRLAYMAGAQHLFAALMVILDEDAEPTDTDMRRMELINKELAAFADELRLMVKKPRGSA